MLLLRCTKTSRSHSFISSHASTITSNPGLQPQLKEPIVFSQSSFNAHGSPFRLNQSFALKCFFLLKKNFCKATHNLCINFMISMHQFVINVCYISYFLMLSNLMPLTEETRWRWRRFELQNYYLFIGWVSAKDSDRICIILCLHI